MIGDVRSLGDGLPSVFDFNSQSGILFLLRAIRAADVSPAEKNKLKDLVFLYNTSGKDEAIKNKLAAQLAVQGVIPACVLQEVVTSPLPTSIMSDSSVSGPGFPVGRRTPVFLPPPATTPRAASTSTPNVTLMPVPAVEKITPVVPRVTPPLAAVSVPNSVPVQHVEDKPVATMSEIIGPVSPTIEIEKNVTAVPAASALVNSPLTEAAASVRMERIRVIKSEVNARVGNPVNLVDVDNAVGREYMSALLEAMKLLSSAGEAEAGAAMNRLEKVYTEVLSLLATKAKETEASEVPTASIVTEQNAADGAELPLMPNVNPKVAAVMPLIPVPVNDFQIRSKVTERDDQHTSGTGFTASDLEIKNTAPPIDVVSSVATTMTPSDTEAVARLVTPPAEPLRLVVNSVTPLYQPETAQSVSTLTPLRAITELPTADEVSAEEAMSNNPLYTKDVDAGLDQLLSEWAIFKKSGLFGSGPKGREHPLYVKIAPLQVPLILSGRFEGSTQEIKQSITDYMNGWRYEQGIVYEANETLDVYLRRVIRHIIDLQKTKRRS